MTTTTFAFRPSFDTDSFSAKQSELVFGIGEAQADYNIPVMRFSFKDARGGDTGFTSSVYIRMTSSFETILANPYQEQEGIFGQPVAGSNAEELKANMTSITNILASGGKAGIEAVKKQILAGIGATGGFIASAGASGISQTEFLTRQFFNNFQQLIYKGPQFRRFSPSFTMRPTSYQEAKNMKDIISLFRIASSPTAGNVTGLGGVENAGEIIADTEKLFSEEGAPDIAYFDPNKSDQISGGSLFTFGYPSTCYMEILMFKPGTSSPEISPLFKSQLSVIESVSVTYGSQNKMTFFKPDTGAPGQYFPTEVVLQLQLRELVLISSSTAIDEFNDDNRTIV